MHARRYDKPISLLVFGNGKAGVNAEHGHFDAPVPGRVFAFVNRRVAAAEARDAAASSAAGGALGAVPASPAAWRTLDVDLPASVKTAILAAPAAFEATRAGNRLVPLKFEGGGRKAALAVRPLSADSLVQMALQLAQLRDQQTLVATYESATTRRFAYGRTETVRSCSRASADFCRTMLDAGATAEDKRSALGRALAAHGEWLVAGSNGKGVDRHLMGLRITAAAAGDPMPDLFSDPAYAKSTTFELSTSNTSSPGVGPAYEDFGGFGAPTVHSYGVAYQIQEQCIHAIVSSDAASTGRDANRFAGVVRQALSDVFALIEGAGAREVLAGTWSKPKAKL